MGIVKNVVRGEKGKIKSVEFKKPKIKRADYGVDTLRTQERKDDYAMRGISKGGRITKFKSGNQYKDIKTDANGNLQRLTLDSKGNLKEAKKSFQLK